MRIHPIVEGHGEMEAVPVLLRRLLAEAQCFDVEVSQPMRRTQSQLRGEQSIQAAVRVALLQPDCRAILILFDCEDGCPVDIAAQVRAWARAAAGSVPCEVVVAHREYETWFLAALESLRGQRGIKPDAIAPAFPESRRDAKAWLEEFMPDGCAYSETQDQPALSARFDLAVAFGRNRSFRKLVTSLGDLLDSVGRPSGIWPPASWITPEG
jgi:hypothetical protein